MGSNGYNLDFKKNSFSSTDANPHVIYSQKCTLIAKTFFAMKKRCRQYHRWSSLSKTFWGWGFKRHIVLHIEHFYSKDLTSVNGKVVPSYLLQQGPSARIINGKGYDHSRAMLYGFDSLELHLNQEPPR